MTRRWGTFGRPIGLLLAALALAPGPTLAADVPAADAPASISRAIPDLHLSISETPGETTLCLLQREPDSADFRAGFSIRLD